MSTKLAIILAAMSLPTASLPALAQDFSGIYGGVDLISDRFDAEDLSYGPGPVDANGLGVGVFAGYNWQSGNIVFGPELYLTSHSADCNDGAYFLPFSAKRSMGVKARLGYTIGNIMPYLSVGTVRTKVEADHTGGGDAGRRHREGNELQPRCGLGCDRSDLLAGRDREDELQGRLLQLVG